MKIIGITGVSGSGKTTISKMIQQQCESEIIDADQIAKDLTQGDTNYLREIIAEFGEEILDENHKLKRQELANIIFKDKAKKEKLDNITQKYVVEEIKDQIRKSKSQLIILDVPLLFESKLNEICDITIGIISNQQEEIRRICARDNITSEQAIARLKNQNNNEFFEKNCDYIVENTNLEIAQEELNKILLKLQ